MHRCRTYVLTVLFFAVAFPSLCDSNVNESSFTINARSKLKILAVFGHLGKSHFDVFKPMVEELARRGHDITVLSHFPRSEDAKKKEALPNYKDISLLDPKVGIYIDVIDLHHIRHTITRFVKELTMLRYMADMACTNLKKPDVKKLLQSDEKFDLILTENFNTDCFLGFIHRFKAPFIMISSHQIMPWTNEIISNEDNPSYIPILFNGVVRPMSYYDRILNTLFQLFCTVSYNYWFRPYDNVIAKEVFGPDLPNLKEISKQARALLVNTHSSLHGSRPQLPNIVEIGGLHIPSKAKPLPKDIAEFLDSAPEGVLYFNFGSMIKISTIPQKKLNVLIEVLSSLPRKVIWKWESDVLSHKMDNIMARKWLPQFDVLSHPNVKCYLGHGGLLGLSEGVYTGVPMVLIPMYGDQFHNAAAAANRGAAIVLSFNDLDEKSLRHALDEIFNNTIYRDNVKKLSKAYRDRPASPLETAVWWTEYIARGNGNAYLRSEAADLSWYQLYLFDVALFLIVSLALLIYISYRLTKLFLWLLRVVIKRIRGERVVAQQNGDWKKKN